MSIANLTIKRAVFKQFLNPQKAYLSLDVPTYLSYLPYVCSGKRISQLSQNKVSTVYNLAHQYY